MNQNHTTQGVQHTHTPVLVNEICSYLDVVSQDIVVDGTVGQGGHALRLVTYLGDNGTFVGIDKDSQSIDRARHTLKDLHPRLYLSHADFTEMKQVLSELSLDRANKIILDLGWHIGQFRDPSRGFSFEIDGPLDMRLDHGELSPSKTAAEIIAMSTADELVRILREYGDESHARSIAQAIVQTRKRTPIRTSHQLASLIQDTVPKRPWLRTHPATKTFQALRIAVNRELERLEEFLGYIPDLLLPGGRVAIISFHSAEDRLVKNMFREYEDRGIGKRLSKKPITPSPQELHENPRARSAKLRVFEVFST